MTPTLDQLRWYHAQLQAHDSGCRLRYYDWWAASAACATVTRRFVALMTLGTVAQTQATVRLARLRTAVAIEMQLPTCPLPDLG